MTIMRALAPITATLLTGIIPINAMQDRLVKTLQDNLFDVRSRGQPLIRGRGLTVNIRNKAQEDVVISYLHMKDGVESWTKTATLTPPGDVVADQFGGGIVGVNGFAVNFFYNMDMLQTPVATNVFLAGAAYADGTEPNTGAVYVYSGEWSKWSHQQTLTLATQNENDLFGTSLAINKADISNAVITCLGCDPYLTNSSAIYIYKSEAPLHNRWSQQQVLIPYDKNVMYLGYGVALHDSTLVLSGSTRGDAPLGGDPAIEGVWYPNLRVGTQNSIYVYHRPAGTQHWTELQKLDGTSSYGLSFMIQVEDETIGISDGRLNFYSSGILKIYYPDTARYQEKPKAAKSLAEEHSPVTANFILTDTEKPPPRRPRAPQWSLQQILTDPYGSNIDGGFGSYFSFHGNSMVVTRPLHPDLGYDPLAPGRALYIYERPSLGGQWSVQQAFSGFANIGDDFYPPTWYGPTVIFGDSFNDVYMYSAAKDWSCIVISLEDSFGDGWGEAVMHATAPDGTLDLYRPYCDSANPLAFRYCPLDGGDRGLYTFTIHDVMKTQFPWEIQWQIFEEKTGKWYRGNDRTRMDFYWEPTTRDFTSRGIVNDVPLNISCVNNCKSRPTAKPSPEGPPHRALKSSSKSSTHAPTNTPAPTLGQTTTTVWEYLTLTGSGWFDASHRGTNYYISDIKGKRLVATGTKCVDTTQNCWQSLPDGQYILRVTGHLNTDGSSREWAFCGRRGTSKDMLVFSVTDGQCDALEYYTRSTYCSNKLKTAAFASVTFLLHGVNQFSVQNQRDLISSMSYLLTEVPQEDIHVVSATASSENLLLEMSFAVPVTAYGYDVDDLSSISETYNAFMTKLNDYVSNSRVTEAMASTSSASTMSSLTSVEIVENHISLNEVLPAEEVEVVTTFEPDEEAVTYYESESSTFSLARAEYLTEKIAALSGAGAGYLIFGTLIVVTLFFIQGKARGLYAQTVTGDDEKTPEEIMATAEKEQTPFGLRVRNNLSSLEKNLVSFLDDVGDVVVDFIAPPEEEYQAPSPIA